MRAGLRALLQEIEGLEVVAEAKDGREAVARAKEHCPDVVFMDITMPGLNGLEATSRLLKECPRTRVLILSMHSGEEYVLQALRQGASGYLLKDADPSELETAINAVLRGDIYLSPRVTRFVRDFVIRSGNMDWEASQKAQADVFSSLTPRQREVLQLIAEGYTTKEIAHVLDVHVKTVETHRSLLMDRLNIHEIAGLVRYAVRVGLIGSED